MTDAIDAAIMDATGTEPVAVYGIAAADLEALLRAVGADTGDGGRILYAGAVVSLMGMGNDLLVGATGAYFIDGEPQPVARLLEGDGRRPWRAFL